jgi:hypothetical protein
MIPTPDKTNTCTKIVQHTEKIETVVKNLELHFEQEEEEKKEIKDSDSSDLPSEEALKKVLRRSKNKYNLLNRLLTQR